jgi:CDGSH-type Zn-finger protein
MTEEINMKVVGSSGLCRCGVATEISFCRGATYDTVTEEHEA